MSTQFSGRRVASLVVALVVLTAVIPPAAAYGLARWRVSRAMTLAERAAPLLSERRGMLRDSAAGKDVLCGPGRVPAARAPGLAWIAGPVKATVAFEPVWPQDPWGRCYLLNARAVLDHGAGLLISAGPNGTIDTPLDAASPAGDDIGVVVR